MNSRQIIKTNSVEFLALKSPYPTVVIDCITTYKETTYSPKGSQSGSETGESCVQTQEFRSLNGLSLSIKPIRIQQQVIKCTIYKNNKEYFNFPIDFFLAGFEHFRNNKVNNFSKAYYTLSICNILSKKINIVQPDLSKINNSKQVKVTVKSKTYRVF